MSANSLDITPVVEDGARSQEIRSQDTDIVLNQDDTTTSSLISRLCDVFVCTYDLGFIAFGGPPVHFQILHRRFVDGLGQTPWIDEKIYQELFAITQALPGPASTKMLFSIAQIHAGILPAILAFILWSVPGAIAMYSLSLGVQQIDEVLPSIAYAVLSGLNAATVGVIALSAVQLARKSISDQLTRILVVFGGCAGLLYNALWYFPTLILIGGVATLIWDSRTWLWRQNLDPDESRPTNAAQEDAPNVAQDYAPGVVQSGSSTSVVGQRESRRQLNIPFLSKLTDDTIAAEEGGVQKPHFEEFFYSIPPKMGIFIIILFVAVFMALMVLRGVITPSPLLFSLFNSMFLAGTIIFGGGPVVIPLLREYVVVPGWVSSRDFLLGLAIIQALPGPNFNFAVFLGAMTVASSNTPQSVPTVVGALLGFLGIFAPGIWLSIGFQSVWSLLRSKPYVISIIRGINATAVGLVFTAVYRLWEIGYLSPDASRGSSLGWQPWWLVVATLTYTIVEWFYVPPALAILMGALAGLLWYAVGQDFPLNFLQGETWRQVVVNEAMVLRLL